MTSSMEARGLAVSVRSWRRAARRPASERRLCARPGGRRTSEDCARGQAAGVLRSVSAARRPVRGACGQTGRRAKTARRAQERRHARKDGAHGGSGEGKPGARRRVPAEDPARLEGEGQTRPALRVGNKTCRPDRHEPGSERAGERVERDPAPMAIAWEHAGARSGLARGFGPLFGAFRCVGGEAQRAVARAPEWDDSERRVEDTHTQGVWTGPPPGAT